MLDLLGVVLVYIVLAMIVFVILLAPIVVIGLVLAALSRLLGISYDGERFTRRQKR